MILGDGGAWLDHFRRYDERLLERICVILPACIAALGDNPQEDDITLNLVGRFHHDAGVRRLFHHWEFHFEPHSKGADGAYFSKGQIDFAVFWDLDRERYLAYEAKRLNVKSRSGTTSLATPYVKEGVVRFVTEQYSQGLPLGCMLGYVLDGNLGVIPGKLKKALNDNQTLVGLVSGPTALPSIGSSHRFETDHDRQNDGGRINIRHALVPCS